jgi:hypothetical protein
VRAQELVAEITVAVFDVDEIEAEIVCDASGGDEVVDDLFDVIVGEERGVAVRVYSSVEQWMMIEKTRLGTHLFIGTAEATRVREL